MKKDPFYKESAYKQWLEQDTEEGVSPQNLKIIREYLKDTERGFFVKQKSGYDRLNGNRNNLCFVFRNLEKIYNIKDITKIKHKDLDYEMIYDFFDMVEKGKIKGRSKANKKGERKSIIIKNATPYKASFKTFWNWYMRKQEEKHKKVIPDITKYIQTTQPKESEFVYLTIEQIRSLTNRANFKYKTMIWLIFDTGIRAPKELSNVKVKDITFEKEHAELNIRNEYAKTFGRKIKLMLCSNILKEYINDNNLQGDDYLFKIYPSRVNQYLKKLSIKVFGDIETKGGKKTSQLSLYDFRHSGACYWLPRYKNESALKYRFGWKTSKMIQYYTNFLGMKDTISQNDLLLNEDATKLEAELEKQKLQTQLANEKLEAQAKELKFLMENFHKHKEVVDWFNSNKKWKELGANSK